MATLAEIAAEAGVSPSTASRVLNNAKLSERISEDCARRVRAVADKHGYVGGYHRRVLRTRKSETLGMAVEILKPGQMPPSGTMFDSHYFRQLAVGVENATHYAGYNLQMVAPSQTSRAIVRGVKQIRERRIDGLIVPHVNSDPGNTVVLAESPMLPIAVVQPTIETRLPTVEFDHSGAGEMAVRHLLELGHRTVLWMGACPARAGRHLQLRERGFMKAVLEAGATAEFCQIQKSGQPADMDSAERGRLAAEEALEQTLQAGRRFTGIVCENDLVAVGACRVLLRHGLRVPQDVSVTGIDNTNPSWSVIRLTSVDHCLTEMSHRAAEIVLEMVAGGDEAIGRLRGYSTCIKPKLHRRESTGPAASVGS